MDGEPGNELKIEMAVDSTNEEDTSPVTVYRNEKEGDPDEMVAADRDEENSESMKEAATSEPEDNSGNSAVEFRGVDHITSSEGLDVKMKKVNEQLMPHEDSVVFKINSTDDDGPPRLHSETPERQSTSPTQEEDEAEEKGSTAAPAHKDINYEEYMQLHRKLYEDRNIASQRHSRLQMKLAEFFRRKAWNDTQLEREMSEQLLKYEKYINILTALKQQLTADMETAQQQAEDLRLKSQEKLNKVETEWRAFTALKQDVAVAVLSRCLGKEVAQAKVEATLATEKLLQYELNKLRIKHIKLRIKIHRLETKLCEGEEHARDPLQFQFERLRAERLKLKKHTEKQNEECLKMQKKIISSKELLSNIKEKLFWSQMGIQAKREQLATLEAMVATKRDLLTRTRQACSSLQRDNLRLKEHCGLQGNRVLLQDFEDTVDASDDLAKHLEDLKCLQAEIVVSCGRWKKKLEIT